MHTTKRFETGKENTTHAFHGLSNDVYLFRGAIFRAFRAADVIRSDVIVAFVLTLSLLGFGSVDVLQEVVATGARRR